ncbi:hypothetical protein LCGC14_1430000, partial [marine sediment metagenome]
MPTLNQIRDQRIKREFPFEPNRPSKVGTIERAEKVFDLSGGYRLSSNEDYQTYYGFEHQH